MTVYEESDEYCPHCDNHYVRIRFLSLCLIFPTIHQVIEAKTPHAVVGVEGEDARVDARCVRWTVWLCSMHPHFCSQYAQRRTSETSSQAIHLSAFGWWSCRSHRMIPYLLNRIIYKNKWCRSEWCGCVTANSLSLSLKLHLHLQRLNVEALKTFFFYLYFHNHVRKETAINYISLKVCSNNSCPSKSIHGFLQLILGPWRWRCRCSICSNARSFPNDGRAQGLLERTVRSSCSVLFVSNSFTQMR